MPRQHRQTSKEGEQYIKPFKPNHKSKIKEALRVLRIGGTQEEISLVCGLRPDQVWKRCGEMEKEREIFNTGITRKLKSGLSGIVWQLVGGKIFEATDQPKTVQEQKDNKTYKQLSLLQQSNLFS